MHCETLSAERVRNGSEHFASLACSPFRVPPEACCVGARVVRHGCLNLLSPVLRSRRIVRRGLALGKRLQFDLNVAVPTSCWRLGRFRLRPRMRPKQPLPDQPLYLGHPGSLALKVASFLKRANSTISSKRRGMLVAVRLPATFAKSFYFK